MCPLSPVFLYSLSKKLEFVPVASAITTVHRDCLILASNVRWPEIQPLVSWGQIVSTDLPLLTDRQPDRRTDKYNFSVMVAFMHATRVVISTVLSSLSLWLHVCCFRLLLVKSRSVEFISVNVIKASNLDVYALCWRPFTICTIYYSATGDVVKYFILTTKYAVHAPAAQAGGPGFDPPRLSWVFFSLQLAY